MIIFRYLAREVLTSMVAVSLVLLLILLSGHFARLLADTAAGKLDISVVFTVIGFMALRFLEIVLSLGLFIGIIFSYGRMHVDSEMTVLSACGVSEKRLLAYTLTIAIPVSILFGFISLHFAPLGYKVTHQIVAEQRNRTDFEAIQPARFNRSQGDGSISYAESISEDKQKLFGVFMARLNLESNNQTPELLIAKSGETVVDNSIGRKYLSLSDGVRYLGQPGTTNYEIIEFDEYHQFLPEPDYKLAKRKQTAGMSFSELLVDDSQEAKVAIQWRLSLPVFVFIIAFLALPFSRTKPRGGRYNKLIPAILVYVFYVFMMQLARGELEKNADLSPLMLWGVHLLFLILALIMFNSGSIARLFRRGGKSNAVAGAAV